MKKLLSLGLVLLALTYALPLVYEAYYRGVDAAISQDAVPVNAETDVPSDTGDETAAAGGAGSAVDLQAAGSSTGDKTDASVQALASLGNTTIRVLVDGKVQEMGLETYVAGVVAAEISPTFPADALRAQAVAARTYAVHKLKNSGSSIPAHQGADVCADFHHCTAFVMLATEASARWGKNADTYESAVAQAVQDTAGEIMTVSGTPIVAVFCAASGPKTEAAKDVWGSEISYLQSVDSPGGEACPKYTADVTVSIADFRKKVGETFPSADVSGTPDTWFKASVRTGAGGVKTVQLGGVRVEGTAVRDMFALNSTNFTITPGKDGITFHTIGYGHGVGLSQYGAKYMAEQGSDYKTILTHYYTGAALTKI